MEDDPRTNLRHLDLEDARVEGDTLINDAFHGTYLISLKLPKTLKKIGSKALNFNVVLKELVIPENVTEIGESAIAWCYKLEKVRLPDNLEILNDYLFTNCVNLKEVNIPSKLRELHNCVFYGCTKINPAVAILPETVEVLDGSAYYGINTIEEVVVPKNVRVLKETYSSVAGLRKATILTDKLTEIGDMAFHWCSALEEVNIPDNITRIGNGAFFLTKLKKIDIPSTVTYIGITSFCSAPLDSIDIPAGVTFIGREAFWNNSKLRKVYARPIIPPKTNAKTDVFAHMPFESSVNNAVLYVPKGSAEAYRQSEVFKDFPDIVELEEWQWPSSIITPDVPTTAYKVYGSNGMLCIDATGNGNYESVSVNIYNISGTTVWKGKMTSHAEIPLPTGFYLAQVGKNTYKVSL